MEVGLDERGGVDLNFVEIRYGLCQMSAVMSHDQSRKLPGLTILVRQREVVREGAHSWPDVFQLTLTLVQSASVRRASDARGALNSAS